MEDYVEEAAEMDLGTGDPEKMELIKLELAASEKKYEIKERITFYLEDYLGFAESLASAYLFLPWPLSKGFPNQYKNLAPFVSYYNALQINTHLLSRKCAFRRS